MAVDVPNAAEMLVSRVHGVLHGALVGLVVAHDALRHLVDRKLAPIDRLAGIENAPDEADSELGLAAPPRGPGPWAVDEGSVDVEERAIGIDVAAREVRRDERGAERGARRIELVDEAV